MNKKLLSMIKKALCCGMALSMAAGSVLPAKAAENASLIARLDGVEFEKRTARFVCAVAAVYPDGKELVVRETMEGYIGYEEKGANGFGYDPIFYLKEFDKTSAEISLEEKNEISHRGKAFRAIKALMEA